MSDRQKAVFWLAVDRVLIELGRAPTTAHDRAVYRIRPGCEASVAGWISYDRRLASAKA